MAKMKTPRNIAHRGGAGLWPENTLYAFREAARAGFDGAELDVQLTRDGELVVFHDFVPDARTCRDANAAPLAGPQRPVCDWSFAELLQLDVGEVARSSPECAPMRCDGERIPLLRDVISAVRSIEPDFELFIELKTAFHDRSLSAAPESVAEAVVTVLREMHFEKNATLVGFEWPALMHVKRIVPELECWFTTLPSGHAARKAEQMWAGDFAPARFGGSIARAIHAAGGDGWLAHHDEGDFAQARWLGLKTGIWTVNDEAGLRAALKRDVDAIVTDRPEVLQRLLQSLE
jgi:glycerophosphoryl diester phosphodiesterase